MASGRRHLAIFIRSLEGGGGAERMMVSLARGFAERGHRVDLVLGTARGAFLDDVPDTVRIVELGRHSVLRAVPTFLRDPRSALKLAPAFRGVFPHWVLGCIPDLARYLSRERPDAMLSALNYSNIAALWARRFADAPTRLVVSERNTLTHRAQVRRRNLELPALTAAFYPWADAIAAVSEGVADDLASASGISRDRITTTYNPVVGPEIEQDAKQALDDPWFGDDAVPVILAAGKLKKQKGFETLVEAFGALRERHKARLVILGEGDLREALLEQAEQAGVSPDLALPGFVTLVDALGALRERPTARLVILGDGDLRAALLAPAAQAGVSSDLALPGFVDNPFRYMARASLFVLSSRWEGLPGVLIQAMACGCPVVSTDCPSGPHEILAGGRYGELVPVDDPKALADAMERRLDAPRASEELIARAAEFSVERSVDRYLALLLPDETPS
jgi:glycosyltransferase involved in cell wall biosynthesis